MLEFLFSQILGKKYLGEGQGWNSPNYSQYNIYKIISTTLYNTIYKILTIYVTPTLSIMTPSIMTLSIMTFSIMTFSKMTLSITTCRKTINKSQHSA